MKLTNTLLLSSALIGSLSASSLDTQFNYFGNLTASSINEKGYEVNKVINSNVDDKFSLAPYSKVAAQFSIYNDNFMFVTQALAYQNNDKNELELTWLNGRYQIMDGLSIRLGRMQLALFLNSNTIDVDYVHLWTKAPIEIYGSMPLKSFDGIEIAYEKVIQNYFIEFKITPYGKASTNVNVLKGTVKADFTDMKAIALSVQKGNLTLSASYTIGIFDMPTDNITGLAQILGGLEQYGNDVSRYSYKNKDISFLSFGINYNYNNLLFTSEISQIKSESLVPDMTAYYLMMSYRYNKFTPFIMFAENKNDKNLYKTDNIKVVDATSGQLKAGLDAILYNMNSSQQTSSIGLRYDYKVGIAFKAQLDRITFDDYGTYYPNPQSTHQRYGFLSQEVGVAKVPVFQFTTGLSFAF